jgi:GAF domain-containing protein
MIQAAYPNNEAERLFILRTLNLLDTPLEERFDRITRILSNALEMPITALSLIDDVRQWFKSSQGLNVCETSRGNAFCAHAILHSDLMQVPDALQDPRFHDNPLVTSAPHIRFYAGQPIIIRKLFHIGTLCAIDTKPRELTEAQKNIMSDLARIVESEISLHSLSETHFDNMRKKA